MCEQITIEDIMRIARDDFLRDESRRRSERAKAAWKHRKANPKLKVVR